MKKRFWVLWMVCIMIIGSLAGCSDAGEGQESSQGTESSAQGSQAEESSQGAAMEVVNGLSTVFPLEESMTTDMFAYQKTGTDLTKNLAWTTMEELTNMHWDLTLASDGDLDEKRSLEFAGGEYKSVFYKSGISEADAMKYAKDEIVIPLNDLIDQYMPNFKALMDERDGWKYITSSDGNIYSLPQVNDDGCGMMLFINQVWLDKLGLEMPKTFDEYIEVLRAFKEKDPNGNGVADEIPLYLANGALSQLLPYYGIGFDGNTNATYNGEQMEYYPTSEKYKEFLKMARGLSEEGLINNYVLGTWDEQAALGTTQDVLGSLLQWGAYLSVGAEKDEDWPTVVPFENTMVPYLGIQFGGLVLTDKCEHPELILQWADYFYSTEGSDLGWLGVDGESYQRNDDGTYTWLTDGAWGADMAEIRDNATLFGDKPWPGLSSKFFDEGQTNPEEKYLYGQREIVKEHFTERFPKLSYTEDELKRKATYEADINPYISQYEAQVISGEVDLDSTWDEYVATLNNMGLQDLISINQAAVSRFYAE